MSKLITIYDLVALEQGIEELDVLSLPMDSEELESAIEDTLFEGAIATRQRLEGHEEIVAVTESGIELNRAEVMSMNNYLVKAS